MPKFSNDWILMSDADERATPEFKQELEVIVNDDSNRFAGYLVRYHYLFLGKYIRFGDPVRKFILFRKSKARYEIYDMKGVEAIQPLEVGHEHPVIDGPLGLIKNPILHEDTRPLHYYFDRHSRYSTWEAYLIYNERYEKKSPAGIRPKISSGWLNARRFMKHVFLHMPFRPLAYFTYSYFFRLGFLDGYPGFAYNIRKAFYAFQIGIKLHELKLNNKQRGAI
jgi:hypothetical protein